MENNHKFKIVLASPADVSEERNVVGQVVKELNNIYKTHKVGMELELIRWETHTAPGASQTSVQDLIDNDFGYDYDIFIGILWKSFGTPTKKAGSGTEQEFINAYERFQRSGHPQILFYFKTSLNSIKELDMDQLVKVKNFQSSLGTKDILHWEFLDKSDLQQFLLSHIPFRLESAKQILNSSKDNTNKKAEEGKATLDLIDDSKNLGLIDYIDMFNKSFNNATKTILQISKTNERFTEELNLQTNDLKKINQNGRSLNSREASIVLKKTVVVLNNYANTLEPDIPQFMNQFEQGINATINLINLYKTDFRNESAIEKILSESKLLQDTLGQVIPTFQDLLNSVVQLPKVSKDFIRAKSKVIQQLQNLLANLQISYNIMEKIDNS